MSESKKYTKFKVSKRYFIELSYVGTNYHGWQIQNNAESVQGELNRVLSVMTEEEINTLGCGRTDAGVHASQFFCHFDSTKNMDVQNYLYRINKMLPHDIGLKRIFQVKNDAHARFDAASRTYEYLIHRSKSPFQYKRSYQLNYDLNMDLMNEAAKILFEYTNFECFSKSHTQVNNFDCEIMEAFWQQRGDNLVFTIKANRFLRNMVRAIVGSLVEVGRRVTSLAQFREVIESKNRSEAGMSAPAHALYLSSIIYPNIND
ncbi:MAG: tRNA pseudouridine(38-40) synthase TruA [Flavobacteriales bacterium]|nr:tRNA pseudouridine(38-40) synthase TruA [Flavobacteriales bacterium]